MLPQFFMIRRSKLNEDVLFGKYKIIASLGRGGYSHVYLARHIMLDCLRAIKVIGKDNELHDRLVNEALILKSLHHESIPVIYDIEEDEFSSYIIEEYCKGISLAKERKQWKCADLKKIVDYSLQICDVIDYLHKTGRGILYLDLKPSNIIVRDTRLMLVDFGTAVILGEVDNMALGMGTRGYAAPEQYDVNRRPDERSDVYGIGCLISFLVSGHNPGNDLTRRTGDNGIKYAGNMYDEHKQGFKVLEEIITRCVMDDPDKRYLSVAKITESLSKLDEALSRTGEKVGVISKIFRKNPVQKRVIRHNEKLLVGVAGTHPGAGATHLTMMTAQFYSLYLNKSTAVADASVKKSLIKAGKYLPDNIEYADVSNVTYNFAILFEQGIDVVVVDFGTMKADVVNRFNKCDIKLVATDIAPWVFGEFVSFCDRYRSIGEDNMWNYVVAQCDERTLKLINDYYGCRLERTGYVTDISRLSETAIAFMTSICKKGKEKERIKRFEKKGFLE